MEQSDLCYLAVPLPEDIARLKAYGDLERLTRVIDMRLAREIPEALRKRLLLEKEVVRLLPECYPYTQHQAELLMDATFSGFQPEELDRLRDEDAADWAYLNGELRYKDDFVDNLIKTRPELADRVKDAKFQRSRRRGAQLLHDTIARMKERGGLHYRIHLRTSLHILPAFERPGERVRVHMPLPVAYAQVKNLRLLALSPEPAYVAPEDYPQRTACFEGVYPAGQVFSAEYVFENRVRYVRPDPVAALSAQPTFYTEEQPPHVRFTPYIRALTQEVVGGAQSPIVKARRIYDFITMKVMYSFMRPYITMENIPEFAASRLKGDCGVQALLFITMCRCAGVPARWQAGLYATPLSVGNHDWAQFYAAPYGWLFADCSFGGTAYREGDMERWNFYFGNLDPFRVPLNSDFQHAFYPPRTHLRADPYDSQSGEVEYAGGGLTHSQFEAKREMLSIQEAPEEET